MIKLFDRLNTLTPLVVALILFLVVDGFLFYRYWSTMETTAASEPSVDISLATYKEDDSSSGQEEPAVTETDGEAGQPDDGEKKDVLEAEEIETEPAPAQTRSPATPA